MAQLYLIGIDIGTGSTKAVAVDFKGEIICVSQVAYPTLHVQPGYSEQDPEIIWAAFKKSVWNIIDDIGYPPAALSLSSAMHSLIPVTENGSALIKMMTWADARSQEIAESLRNAPEGEDFYKITGTPIHAMSPLTKILWIKEYDKAIFERSFKFISIKEFIWFKLFNVFEADYSIASATGMFDILRLEWSELVLGFSGISLHKLSEVVNTSFHRTGINAVAAAEMNLEVGTPILIGASDGCSANLGSAVKDCSMAALTIGTSGAVRITNSQPIYNFQAMTFNYLLDGQTYICGGAVNNGGFAIDWAIKNLLNIPDPGGTDYETFFSLADQIPAGANGLIFLPYLNGERAPIWDTRTSGSFIGIKPHHSLAHFLRAVLEGVCFTLQQVLATVEAAAIPVKQVHVSGGFIHAPVWLQLLADLLGKKLIVVQSEDASAIGAAMLASKALFPELTSLENMLLSDSSQSIEPNMEKHQVYSRLSPVFNNLYAQLKDSMHILNNLNN